MTIQTLKKINFDSILKLALECFSDDPYYNYIFRKEVNKESKMKEMFTHAINYCLLYGYCLGAFIDDNLVGFVLTFNYNKTKNVHNKDFCKIFGINNYDEMNPIIKNVANNLKGDIIYLLSIGVQNKFCRKGIATILVETLKNKNKGKNIISDVDNMKSLPMYHKLGFREIPLAKHYILVVYDNI